MNLRVKHWIYGIFCLLVAIIAIGPELHAASNPDDKKAVVESQVKEEPVKRESASNSEEHMRMPIDWHKSSETIPYPDLSKVKHFWVKVDLKKNRTYLYDGSKIIYTMYSTGGVYAKDQVKNEKNLNKMLPGESYTVKGVKIDGLKTGTSDSAGACFASTGKYRGHRIVTVILHAKGDDKDNRFKATQELYKILKNEEHLQSIKVPASVTTRKVANGAAKTMELGPHQVTIWSPYDTRTDYTIGTEYKKNLLNKRGKLVAPIWKDERVGSLRITSNQLETLNGEPLMYSLYSSNDVRRGNFYQRLLH